MSLFRKHLLFSLVLFVAMHSCQADEIQDVSTEIVQSFQISRAMMPDQPLIQKEQVKVDQRAFKKYVVTAAAGVSAALVLYVAYKIQQVALQAEHKNNEKSQRVMAKDVLEELLKKGDLVQISKNVAQIETTIESAPKKSVEPLHQSGYINSCISGLKEWGWGTSKFFASNVQMLATGLVMNGAWNFLSSRVSQSYQDETILWYVQEQTKILQILNDLKAYAVDYDLYASLLCADALNQDAQIHMKALVKDLIDSAHDYLGGNQFKDPAYFMFLLDGIKKKYMRSAGQIEKLQDYVVDVAGKRHRAMAQDHASLLFLQDMNRRKDIVHLCELLSKEIEKLTAFILMHGSRQKERAADVITSCNAYVDHMEKLVNASWPQLQEYSKADYGMFTSVYEYEKIFTQQVNHLHRYCKLA